MKPLIRRTKIPFKEIILYGFFPSFIKKILLKIKGYKVGKNVKLSFGSVIVGKNVIIGDNVTLGLFSVIRADIAEINSNVSIGPFTILDSLSIELGEDTVINNNVVVGGLFSIYSSFKTGKRVKIGQHSFINTTRPVEIGDDSGIGGNNQIFTHGSWLSSIEGFPASYGPVKIGKQVWLAWNVFIMPGVSLGDRVVVNACSMVTKSFRSNLLISGSPAKIIIKNYPNKITNDQRNEILSIIIKEFILYLEYYNYEVKKNGNIYSIFFRDNLKSKIIINDDNCNEQIDLCDNLLIKFGSNHCKSDYNMIIDLKKSQRIGTSKIGEEFIRFSSGYGIRLQRLQ
jgi:acetyltransferase-like isoleucine patch superfamily enzyme